MRVCDEVWLRPTIGMFWHSGVCTSGQVSTQLAQNMFLGYWLGLLFGRWVVPVWMRWKESWSTAQVWRYPVRPFSLVYKAHFWVWNVYLLIGSGFWIEFRVLWSDVCPTCSAYNGKRTNWSVLVCLWSVFVVFQSATAPTQPPWAYEKWSKDHWEYLRLPWLQFSSCWWHYWWCCGGSKNSKIQQANSDKHWLCNTDCAAVASSSWLYSIWQSPWHIRMLRWMSGKSHLWWMKGCLSRTSCENLKMTTAWLTNHQRVAQWLRYLSN